MLGEVFGQPERCRNGRGVRTRPCTGWIGTDADENLLMAAMIVTFEFGDDVPAGSRDPQPDRQQSGLKA